MSCQRFVPPSRPLQQTFNRFFGCPQKHLKTVHVSVYRLVSLASFAKPLLFGKSFCRPGPPKSPVLASFRDIGGSETGSKKRLSMRRVAGSIWRGKEHKTCSIKANRTAKTNLGVGNIYPRYPTKKDKARTLCWGGIYIVPCSMHQINDCFNIK